MSSCITASVVKTALPGLRRLVIKQYFSRTVCEAERMKRNRIVNSGLRVAACGFEQPDALTKVVAAPYLVALNVNLQNDSSMLIRRVTQLGIH